MELTRIKSFHPDQMGPLFLGGNLPGETAGPARVPAIVIAGTHQGPAGMGLAFDVGGGSIVLRVQRAPQNSVPRMPMIATGVLTLTSELANFDTWPGRNR